MRSCRSGSARPRLPAISSTARAESPAGPRRSCRTTSTARRQGATSARLGIGGIATGTFFIKSECAFAAACLTRARLRCRPGPRPASTSAWPPIAASPTFGNEINRDGQAWTVRERDRMDGVRTQLTALVIVEAGLIAGGAGSRTTATTRSGPRARRGHRHRDRAAVTLGFDIWASRRANAYRDKLGGLGSHAHRCVRVLITRSTRHAILAGRDQRLCPCGASAVNPSLVCRAAGSARAISRTNRALISQSGWNSACRRRGTRTRRSRRPHVPVIREARARRGHHHREPIAARRTRGPASRDRSGEPTAPIDQHVCGCAVTRPSRSRCAHPASTMRSPTARDERAEDREHP